MRLPSADVFELLHRYGVRTAPRLYASTLEDVVAFARGGPVLLRAEGADTASGELEADGEEEIRRAYERLWPVAVQHEPALLLVLRRPPAGPVVAIDAAIDEHGALVLTLLAGQAASHGYPSTRREADEMVERVPGWLSLLHGERGRSMLSHVLVKAARLFGDMELERMRLAPVVIYENTYEVVDAQMEASRAIEVRHELTRRAHDVKGYYKPSGRQ
ncbi:hypothetical protein EPN52_05295 [bacterium]|nr:MAG: hypothetical protein EPN52_05295 [bacterium]